MKTLLTICWLWISITFIWDPVTQDVSGNPITIDHYNIYRKFHSCGWPKGHVAERTDTSFIWEVPPNDFDGRKNINIYDYAVTAVSVEGIESAKSNICIINSNTVETDKKCF